jgi:DNA-binding beta-propeller fold protein YncE
MRVPGYAAITTLLLTALPGLVFAQTALQYNVQATWPAGEASAPFYRRGEMAGVDTDAQGNVYMCQPTRLPVLVFDRNGNYLRAFGGSGILTEPHSVRIGPDGSVWVADIRQHQVTRFSPYGAILQQFGEKKKRGWDQANRFYAPTDVGFGPNGDIYISDGYGNSRVVHLAADGAFINEWGRHGSEPGEFKLPHSIAVDGAGLVYVADRNNRRIQVFTPSGEFVRMWETIDRPWGLEITPNGRIYVANGFEYTITVYDLQGNLISHLGEMPKKKRKGRRIGDFAQPHMLAIDDEGAMYTAELRGHRVQKFLPGQ